MGVLTGLLKRGVVGRPVRSDRLGETLLPKKIALPVFASDALSRPGDVRRGHSATPRSGPAKPVDKAAGPNDASKPREPVS